MDGRDRARIRRLPRLRDGTAPDAIGLEADLADEDVAPSGVFDVEQAATPAARTTAVRRPG